MIFNTYQLSNSGIISRKGRKSGKPSADAHRKKQTPFGRHQVPSFGYAIEYADKETTGNIDNEGTQWKRADGLLLNIPRKHKPQYGADKSPCPDYHDKTQHSPFFAQISDI